MAGLDKIIKQILDDASSEASELTEKAKQEAASLKKKAEQDCQRIREEADESLENLKTRYKEKSVSSAQLRKRQLTLEAKQKLISDTLDKAYETLIHKDDETYFAFIKRMLKKFAQAKAGEICFSQKDLDRMPSDFETEISKVAEEKGGALRLSEKGWQLDGGFILIYGGIEENCSFKALFNAQRNELSDKVQEMLFS